MSSIKTGSLDKKEPNEKSKTPKVTSNVRVNKI